MPKVRISKHIHNYIKKKHYKANRIIEFFSINRLCEMVINNSHQAMTFRHCMHNVLTSVFSKSFKIHLDKADLLSY